MGLENCRNNLHGRVFLSMWLTIKLSSLRKDIKMDVDLTWLWLLWVSVLKCRKETKGMVSWCVEFEARDAKVVQVDVGLQFTNSVKHMHMYEYISWIFHRSNRGQRLFLRLLGVLVQRIGFSVTTLGFSWT